MAKDIILAKTAGFCFGVERAVNKVYELLETGKKIYTYGPIIHNKEVVKDLEEKGVATINTEEELKSVHDGIIVIRSHGVPKSINDYLDEYHPEYVDMTCPFVKRIHKIVAGCDKDTKVLIAGSPDHPEVQGIMGWCNSPATVISTTEEAKAYKAGKDDKLCLVSQTTFNYNKFKEFIEIFSDYKYNVNVVNTVCDATRNRQQEAAETAKKADLMIVIGDSKSSNSRKLYDICKCECEDTCFIETLAEFMSEDNKAFRDKLSGADTVGITAGASTPKNIIEEVQKYVRNG